MSLNDSVHKIIDNTAVVDVHTHIYDPGLGGLLLWGIDDLLTYHYLVAEVFRAQFDMAYDEFWRMSKIQQADLIWQELFIKRSPVSESCRGIVTVLQKLGLDPNAEDLSGIREYFSDRSVGEYVDTVLDLAGVKEVYMTNDPLDPQEAPLWMKGFERDPRFPAVLRLDSAVVNWPEAVEKLKPLGYEVEPSLSQKTLSEIRRYLNEWCEVLDAQYMAISLPPTFSYPDESSSTVILLTKAVLETARERKIPIGMMIGVKRGVNPDLRLAGDSAGKSDIASIERLAYDYGDVKMLVTMISRENMHELCTVARKFKNIIPFGCWFFLNNPSLVREITTMRLEMLGLSFIPQHSDARVLDQLIYKWIHSRNIIADVLTAKYDDLSRTGYDVTEENIQRDINMLFNAELIG